MKVTKETITTTETKLNIEVPKEYENIFVVTWNGILETYKYCNFYDNGGGYDNGCGYGSGCGNG